MNYINFLFYYFIKLYMYLSFRLRVVFCKVLAYLLEVKIFLKFLKVMFEL